jgi:membrane-bound serine protease (ClpP class)
VIGDNRGHMFLVIAAFFAIFVLPDPWRIPVVVLGASLELIETGISVWVTGRAPVKVGIETLIGATGRVVDACRPDGLVRVNGETWRARCEGFADVDAPVRVIGRSGLTLTVERLQPADSR